MRNGSRLLPLLNSKKFWAFFTLVFVLVLLACGGLTALWISRLDISKLDNPLPVPTYILDRNGNKASQLSSSKLDPVPLTQIPLILRQAVIATEDRRFYDHPGVDIQSILRALIRDLTAGDYAEGGSTITQQLAKNLFLPSDKSLSRKLKEAGYALKIDFTYSKDEILELYLNSIYFGEGIWGVQGAAKQYFGKDVRDLTLEEAALLAGLPKAPTHYSPVKNKDAALERRNLVLSLMKEQGYISEADYEQAKAKPIVLSKNNEDQLKGKYASYVDYVIEEAVERYGFTEDQLLTGGLNIYTELDPAMQKAAQDVYRDDSLFPESKKDQLMQSGAVVLDQHTGGIRALIGYRGDGVFRGFNHATQLKRQPGSTFKPLVVYGPALEKGYTPSSPLYDGPLDLNGYRPEDWDHQYRGVVTLDEAIVKSWNVPAVWLLNEIGIDTGMNFAKRLGITLAKEDRTLGIALGGLSSGVSPLQMAQAYSAFANLGTMHAAHAITKIATGDGHVLVENKSQPVQVMSPSVAYTMTLLLQDAVQRGTGQHAALPRPTAGKSGTTELPDTPEFADAGANSAKDAWFVGYTPELTAAVWLGYDKTDRDHYLTTSGGAVPAVLFREIVSRALQNVPVAPFEVPQAALNPSALQPAQDTQEENHSDYRESKHEGKGKGKRK
jgi:penicillin-binding protein 2A